MRTWAALLVLLLSGCLGSGSTGKEGPAGDGGSTGKDPDADGPLPIGGAARNWTTVELPLGCAYFCEPTVAIDASGAILVRSGQMAISLDGGASFEPRSPPPLPQAAPPGSFQNDGLVQAGPDGRFYFSALITYYSPELQSIVLDGLQVASSADGAVTWDVDTYLSAATTPQSTGLGADRQWLTFGGPGEVYLGYQQVRAALVYHPTLADPASRVPPPPGEIQVAASQDGGRTFTAFRNAVGAAEEGETQIIGMGAVVDGRLLVPYLRFGAADEARVAFSDDAGATFQQASAGPAGDFFPRLVAGEGRLHLVWKTVEDVVVSASSADNGATWSPEQAWSAGNVTSSPWAEAGPNGTLDVVWLERTGAGQYDLLHRSGDGGGLGPVHLLASLEAPDNPRSYTDFMHFSRFPDGRIAAIYADTGKDSVFLAIG